MNFLRGLFIDAPTERTEKIVYKKYRNYSYNQLVNVSRHAEYSYRGLLMLNYIAILAIPLINTIFKCTYEWALVNDKDELAAIVELTPMVLLFEMVMFTFILFITLMGMHEFHIRITIANAMVAKLEGYEEGRKVE